MTNDRPPTYYDIIDLPVGQILLIMHNNILTGLYFMVYKKRPVIEPDWIQNAEIFNDITAQIQEYLTGKRHTFDIPFEMHGTEFQKSVWKQLHTIPYGQTISYKDIAIAVGKPKASRAVGTAVGSNPICIIVPCHRVLASGGKIGGYAGGIEAKKLLLALES